MTDEHLQAIRERYADLAGKIVVQRYSSQEERATILARLDARDLLAEVDRLRSIIRRAYDGDPDDLYEEGALLSGEASQREEV